MSYSLAPVLRAPYLIYRFGVRLQTVNSLRALHDALLKLEVSIRNERARGGPYPDFYDPDEDSDGVSVVDATHAIRPDINQSWHLRWVYGKQLQYANDYVWDGDTRPRGTPIPNTGVRHRGNYYRRPSTQSERRKNQAVMDDDEPRIRCARNIVSIPNAWDDRPRSDREIRNWKEFRNTRWKESKS